MDFNKYQKRATVTFKDHEPLNEEQSRMMDWALGLGGESGEVLELLKHTTFHGEKIDQMKLAKELGDILWYISAIAESSGIHLDDIAELNNAKLEHRYGQEFSNEKSQVRHSQEEDFENTMEYRILSARILQELDQPKNVIIVGPDGSGKTTLAKALADSEYMQYVKCDYRQEDKVALAHKFLDEQINCVYDRFYYPDHPLYQMAKGEPLTKEESYEFDGILQKICKRNTLFIFVDAKMDDITARLQERVEDDGYVNIEQIETVREYYFNWMMNLNSNPHYLGYYFISLDSSVLTQEQMFDESCKALDQMNNDLRGIKYE